VTHDVTPVLTVEIKGLKFSLIQVPGGYRWLDPDSTPTNLFCSDVDSARRAMIYRGPELLRLSLASRVEETVSV